MWDLLARSSRSTPHRGCGSAADAEKLTFDDYSVSC